MFFPRLVFFTLTNENNVPSQCLLGPTHLLETLDYMDHICKCKHILLDFSQLILLLALVRSNSMTMCQRL